MDSGVTLANPGVSQSSPAADDVTYDTETLDPLAPPGASASYRPTLSVVAASAALRPIAAAPRRGAIGLRPMSTSGRSAVVTPAPKITIQPRRYVVASRVDLTKASQSQPATYTLAQQELRRVRKPGPDRLQLIGEEEGAA